LNQIDKATDEDRFWGIDQWAMLFKATTWEEIKMLANKNEALKEAAETIYQNNADQIIRWQCQAREDYENHERYVKRKMKELEPENADLTSALAEKDSVLAKKDQYIKELERTISELQS